MIIRLLDHENMGIDTNFTDFEPQMTSLYQYLIFWVMAAIEPCYVILLKGYSFLHWTP